MAQITPEQLISHLYEVKLPQIYREMDAPLKYPFRRYLSALIEGGCTDLLNDINRFTDLLNPEKIPDEYLPVFCKSFGLDYLVDVPPLYQRRFLQNVGELIKRRGTYSGVKYLIRVLTGLVVDMRITISKDGHGKFLDILLVGETMNQLATMGFSLDVVKKYIKYQIPYNVIPRIDSEVRKQSLKTEIYHNNFIVSSRHYSLIPKNINSPLGVSMVWKQGLKTEIYQNSFVVNSEHYSLIPKNINSPLGVNTE